MNNYQNKQITNNIILSRNLSKAKYLINNFKELAVEKTSDKNSNHNLKSLIEDIISSFGLNQSGKSININIKYDSKSIIEIEAEKKYDDLIIRYVDYGLGIEVDHIDDIFTPFFSTKFGKSSSGLGYNIVKSSFGGTIECESQKNIGTSFTLNLKIS